MAVAVEVVVVEVTVVVVCVLGSTIIGVRFRRFSYPECGGDCDDCGDCGDCGGGCCGGHRPAMLKVFMIPNGVYQENAYLMWDDSLKSGRSIYSIVNYTQAL